MSTTLVLQIIHTTWTKAARGGTMASYRNSVPLAFPIRSPEGYFGIERVSFGARSDFAEKNFFVEPFHQSLVTQEISGPLTYESESLRLQWDETNLAARFKWSAWGAGAPKMVSTWGNAAGNEERFHHDLLVPPDNWVRVRWNGRFSCIDSGRWWYEHTVANIALLSSAVKPHLFIETTPQNEFHRLAILR